MAKDLPANCAHAKVILINTDGFCFGIYTVETREEILLERFGICDGDLKEGGKRPSLCIMISKRTIGATLFKKYQTNQANRNRDECRFSSTK